MNITLLSTVQVTFPCECHKSVSLTLHDQDQHKEKLSPCCRALMEVDRLPNGFSVAVNGFLVPMEKVEVSPV